MTSFRRLAALVLLVLSFVVLAEVVAAPAGSGGTITDRKGFIPFRKQQALPGKVVGILVSDPHAVLSTEGRTGPKDQMCLAHNGASYRWVFVPVENNAQIRDFTMVVGQNGERKKFDKLSMASLETLKPWEIKAPFALVEVEVNEGLGAPAAEMIVATKMRRLDGTKEFPFKVDEIITDARKRYDEYLRDQARQIDEGMEKAAGAAIKDKKATGPRERNDLMFITWLPETERVRIHFRTAITDGDYKYANGINIELPPGVARTARVDRTGAAPTLRLPNGLRYGKQFGIELGIAYEISKTGKLEKTLTLPLETYQSDVPQPALFQRSGPMTMKAPARR